MQLEAEPTYRHHGAVERAMWPERPSDQRASSRSAGSPGLRWARRWGPCVLALAATALVPWTVGLAHTLPSVALARHWSLAWVGLDSCIAMGMIGTAWLGYRGDERVVPVAAATATLMVTDAWFDLCTSAPGLSFGWALAGAAVELPLAALCVLLAAAARHPSRMNDARARLGTIRPGVNGREDS